MGRCFKRKIVTKESRAKQISWLPSLSICVNSFSKSDTEIYPPPSFRFNFIYPTPCPWLPRVSSVQHHCAMRCKSRVTLSTLESEPCPTIDLVSLGGHDGPRSEREPYKFTAFLFFGKTDISYRRSGTASGKTG